MECPIDCPIEYLMTHTVPYVICSGFIKRTLTSWALGFLIQLGHLMGWDLSKEFSNAGYSYFSRKKTLMGSVSICCLILGPGFLHILSFSYKPLTKWVGRYERNSPVMGSTSSSHNPADSIDVLWGQKETLQGTGAATSLKSIVYLL